MKRLIVLMTILGLAMSARSEKVAVSSPIMVSYTDLKWIDVPDPKGSQFAVLSGDPKTGPYTQMRRLPAGTDNPSHTHSSETKNVIIHGVLYFGVTLATAKDFGPGSVVVLPADWVHVSGCRPGAECVFYQEGKGKWDYHPVPPSTAK